MKRFAPGAAAIVAFMLTLPAHSFSTIVAFGDSLSDVGNIQTASFGFFPQAPYFDGRFSNGPVWVEQLASNLGLSPVAASLDGGTNYAYGGARTGTPSAQAPSLLQQSGQYLADVGGIADEDALFVVWGGGNDVLAGDSSGSAFDLSTVVSDLIAAGARDILVPNLPDVGMTPGSVGGPNEAARTADTVEHNAALALALGSVALANPDANIMLFDVFTLFNQLIADGGSFGPDYNFTNVNTVCYDGATGAGGPGNVCANPDEFVFWDTIHPTAAAHALLGDAAAARVVPIPAALPLLFSGLGLIGFMGRRRAA